MVPGVSADTRRVGLCLIVTCDAGLLVALQNLGVIQGRVTDSSGAVIPGAQVQVKGPSADPMGLAAGPNLFAYAGDNPTQAIDLWGLEQKLLYLQFNGGAWHFYSTVQSGLSEPSPKGGYIIQEVQGTLASVSSQVDFVHAHLA